MAVQIPLRYFIEFFETFRDQRLRYFIKIHPLFLVAILFSAVMFARKINLTASLKAQIKGNKLT